MRNPEAKLGDLLALDRTRLAAERNLMAWVRTSLSMLTFGFTIHKFLQYMQERSQMELARPHAPRNLALALIGIGTLVLVVAGVQHVRYVRRLDAVSPVGTWDLALVVAILLALLGVLLFGSILLNAGPFS
jgi:putative membrane protein